MSIPENKSGKTKHREPERKYPDRYVIPESEIRDLVGELTIEQMDAFAVRMQVIADATKQPGEGPARNKLDKFAIQRISQVAAEEKRKRYQKVMEAIKAAVERGGREGIDVTHRTACLAVKLALEWTPEYLSTLRQYQQKLRRIRQRANGAG
jgi:hypothetical protein